jgi:hypothetical protein
VVSPTGNEKTQNSVVAKFESTRTGDAVGRSARCGHRRPAGTTMVTVAFCRP